MKEELDAAARQGDWAAYFRTLRVAKDAQLAEKAELVIPPPEHTSRDPKPEGFQVPGGPAGLVKLAEGLGWLTEVRYARGFVKGVGKAVVLVHSVVARLWHPGSGWHAVAAWEAKAEAEKLSWSVKTAKAWKAGQTPEELGVTGLKDLMRAPC